MTLVETWVLVLNPGDTPVKVDFTFMTPDGPQDGPQDVVIAAGSRRSFEVNDYLTAYDVSIMVRSNGGGIACERSMYGNDRTWATDSIGYAP